MSSGAENSITNIKPVALIGAGPGGPGLLTLRGAELLGRADLVVYDQLVSFELLRYAPPQARLLCVNAVHPHHPDRGPLINQALIEAAQKGLRVVRLKGGDPFLFGRGGEEAEALLEAGLSFEVVPGVTAALGASACAGIPLTHRSRASAVALITGHEYPGKPESMLDWPGLSCFPGTLVFYMGLFRLPEIVSSLIQNKKAPNTPAAAIQWATTNRQRTVISTLAGLPEAVRSAGLEAPTLVIVGSVVELQSKLTWFENRQLSGQKVLVTRPKEQANDLVFALEELGAQVILIPTIEIIPPVDFQSLDAVLASLDRLDWLVFTSTNGVRGFMDRLLQSGRDLRALARIQIAAIGSATATCLKSYHIRPDLIPESFRSESLIEVLLEKAKGKRVLLARADRGREVLQEQLNQVASVEAVIVYRQVDLVLSEEQVELLNGGMDFIILTSSNIARSLVGQLKPSILDAIHSGRTKLVSISPVTSKTINDLGLPVAGEAREATNAGLVAILCEMVKAKMD